MAHRSRGRSAFLADPARREIKRRRLLRIFERDEPIWRDEDHPELPAGAVEWVRQMRGGSESHFESSELRHERD